MGVDVYLYWDGMTKAENGKQTTGFSIGAGAVGYLRASIGMKNEIFILEHLFPAEFWSSDNEEGLKYNFKENYEKCIRIGVHYLLAGLTGKQADIRIEYDEMVRALSYLFPDAKKIEKGKIEDFRSMIMWLNSLFDFFDLGYRLQEERKNPRVFISA